jgi:glycosyltransferase involved in cell wall biosynthesis
MAAQGQRKKALMLAYVFPPFFSVGGSIRAVKFAKYLPEFGWDPMILTIDDSREYESQRREGSESLLKELPESVRIFRTTAGEAPVEVLERGRAARQRSRLLGPVISGLGRLRGWAQANLLLPDEHITWLPFAVRAGRRIVREHRPDVIFATCPPHSVVLAGALLSRQTGLPLVLDYRDDWIDTPRYRAKPAPARWLERRLEAWAVRTAQRVILVTEASRQAFLARYPHQDPSKFPLIPNGVDLEQFRAAWDIERTADGAGPFRILHAGLLSVSDDWHRSPEALFRALSNIREARPEVGERLEVTFTGRLPEPYREMAQAMGLEGTVREAGYLPQPEYLRSLRQADLLLAVNYDGFDTLVPGKIYEYWAVGGPPILLLSCPGAAEKLVRENQLGLAVSPHDPSAIEGAILEAYQRRESGRPLEVRLDGIERFDRRRLAERLAGELAAVSGGERS